MALIKCDECGASISERASVCPHCGASGPSPSPRAPGSRVSSPPSKLLMAYGKKLLEYFQTLELYTSYGDRYESDTEIREVHRELAALRSQCIHAGCDLSGIDAKIGHVDQSRGEKGRGLKGECRPTVTEWQRSNRRITSCTSGCCVS